MTKTNNRYNDAALGRFPTPDPLALASAAHSTYHYAMGNPVMFNDPLGLKSEATQGEFQPFWDVALALTKENGGHWTSSSGWIVYESSAEGFYEGAATMSRNEAWGLYPGWAYDYREAAANYNGGGNRSQVASVSTGGYVISGGYYKTASGAPTTVNGKSGDFTAYYVGGNGSENVKARTGVTFAQAKLWYQFGGGAPMNVNINTIDFSGVSMSDFNSRGLATVRLDGKHYSNIDDALVHGTITLQRTGKANQAKVALNSDPTTPQLNGRPAAMYDFEMHAWGPAVNWVRNPLTFIGGVVNGLMPIGGTFTYVGGTPFPIYYYGTVTIEQSR